MWNQLLTVMNPQSIMTYILADYVSVHKLHHLKLKTLNCSTIKQYKTRRAICSDKISDKRVDY